MNINTTILSGRLTKDAEERYTKNNKRIVNMSMVHNKKYKSNGEWHETPVFINVTTYNQYIKTDNFTKGVEILVEGGLDFNEFEGKDGKRVKYHYINAFKVHLVSYPKSHNNAPVMTEEPQHDNSEMLGKLEEKFGLEKASDDGIPF